MKDIEVKKLKTEFEEFSEESDQGKGRQTFKSDLSFMQEQDADIYQRFSRIEISKQGVNQKPDLEINSQA